LTELLNTADSSTTTIYSPNVQPTCWATGAEAGFDYLRQLGAVTLATRYNITQAVTNTSFELDTANPEVRDRFAQESNDRTQRLVRGFRAEAIDTLELDTAAPYLPALQHFFKTRERRRS